LGKKFAGQQVLVDEIESGVWILKVGRFIPHNEEWLHDPENDADLERAIEWAEKNPPRASDLDDLEGRLA
jgi:hypothetical protein